MAFIFEITCPNLCCSYNVYLEVGKMKEAEGRRVKLSQGVKVLEVRVPFRVVDGAGSGVVCHIYIYTQQGTGR